MNKEKKLLAISEKDFESIIEAAGQKHMFGADAIWQTIILVYREKFVKFMGGLCTDIHKELFSDKYVIGTKEEAAEADKL